MHSGSDDHSKPIALALLSSERPRNVGWMQAAGLLFGDWGTSRLYVLGIALFFAARTSFWLICMMSTLILAVGWGYSQICRIYPDGGGVYTAAKHKSQMLAVIGALLLFADYTVTASLSSLDAFAYFGLPVSQHVHTNDVQHSEGPDAGANLDVHRQSPPDVADKLLAVDSPGLWAIVAIAAIGAFNMMGPKHTGLFALMAAVGMVFITLLISAFALPQVPWSHLFGGPHPLITDGPLWHDPKDVWMAFVSIVLALSGVEAIANLTGVMKRPVPKTASKAIFVVAIEVAFFNVFLAVCMLAIFPLNRDAHQNDMMAFLSGHYVGLWGEFAVRIIGGVLLLSATNTAITDMVSIQYLMARDGELPQILAKLNRFGVPWIPALLASSVPIVILLISHDLDSLADLYAIGVVGAVAINISLCAIHPRLRKWYRKIPMGLLGIILLCIWVSIAFVKTHALIFVSVVMVVGLTARQINKWFAGRKGVRPSLLRQAIAEQLTPEAMAAPKLLVGSYGSEALATAALREAKAAGATLVVCFIRQLQLSYKYRWRQLNIDTDMAALKVFSKFLEMGHNLGVPVLPVYDTGEDSAELMAEAAAIYGVQKVLIGSSRHGALYHAIKGYFQRHLEQILPPDVKVQVLRPDPPQRSQPQEEHQPAVT
ncbi:MAG TPA: APC family permease [Tepidisphaeraceae bacterium]|nr:APC family permease [Tepidisphaeraceae bacterium]